MELRYRVIRHRVFYRYRRFAFLPLALLEFLVALFRPIYVALFPRHEILFHALFLAIYPIVFVPLLYSLESDAASRVAATLVFALSLGLYYTNALIADPLAPMIALSAVSLGSLAALYIVTSRSFEEASFPGFVSIRRGSPYQLFRFSRTRESFGFLIIARLASAFRSRLRYAFDVALFVFMRKAFLKPRDVIRALLAPKFPGRPALVLPAEPRAYVLGTRHNLGGLSLAAMLASALAFSFSPEAYVTLFYGISLSGLPILAAYAKFYGFRRLDAYIVIVRLSAQEAFVSRRVRVRRPYTFLRKVGLCSYASSRGRNSLRNTEYPCPAESSCAPSRKPLGPPRNSDIPWP